MEWVLKRLLLEKHWRNLYLQDTQDSRMSVVNLEIKITIARGRLSSPLALLVVSHSHASASWLQLNIVIRLSSFVVEWNDNRNFSFKHSLFESRIVLLTLGNRHSLFESHVLCDSKYFGGLP